MTLTPLLLLWACATGPGLRADASDFTARDGLKTAYQALQEAETDTGGHRIRAQLETRAALEALGPLRLPAREVPFTGPPTLAVALALLERSARQLSHNPRAQEHTLRALAELREALK
jgi:hypothetical protein